MAKTVKDLKAAYDSYDFVTPFKEVRPGNYLLQELGLFATTPSKSPSARIADIVESEASELQQNDRYGTDENAVKIDKSTMYQAEIPVVVQAASVRPHDWQGRISAVDGKEMSIEECIAARAERFNIDYRERLEKIWLWLSLKVKPKRSVPTAEILISNQSQARLRAVMKLTSVLLILPT